VKQPEQNEDFGALLEQFEREQPSTRRGDLPKVGDTVRGRVVSIGSEAVFVELGGKAEATIDLSQVMDEQGEVRVSVGDTIEARVVEMRGGTAVLRTTMGTTRGADARNEIAQAHTHGIPVEGLVAAVIKGGVEVQVAGMRAFCPISQLDDKFVQDANAFIGQRLTFRITRFETDRKNPNIVLSRRALLEEVNKARAAETRASLREGAVVTGKVTSIKPYGAFIDLGGLEGMIHVSELGFGRVDNPADVLHEGQEVEVQVLRLEKTGDPKRPERIALSLKALAQDPWEEVEQRFPQGTQVRGKVTRLQQYGAFVEVLPGIEGLVHISQLAAGRHVQNPREVVRVGDEVEVTVLGVDRAKRRISLAMIPAGAEHEANAEDLAQHTARSTAPAKLGTFADLLNKSKKR
jgi:small subunit ribosomal protein S1